MNFALDVEASDTIYNLKTMIEEATVSRNGSMVGVPTKVQQLFCNNVQLVTGALSDNNIQAGATIMCTWNWYGIQEALKAIERDGYDSRTRQTSPCV